jgi:inositol-phosphate phosphatase/L-galactose 1-phosphate phosphatase/histidinol-phosphatase
LGEEFGYEKSHQKEKDKKKYTWVIDPIDGTSSFVAGRPIFGIMLGLLENDKPILGGVYQPITDELWLGYKGKTTLNKKLVKVRKPAADGLVIATTSPKLLDKKGLKYWDGLRKKAKNTIYGGDCYNYCLLASGFVDVVYEQGLKPHDYLPLIPILQGAGAKVELTCKKDATCDILAHTS